MLLKMVTKHTQQKLCIVCPRLQEPRAKTSLWICYQPKCDNGGLVVEAHACQAHW
jgi:ribosomal protein L37AE/L43A